MEEVIRNLRLEFQQLRDDHGHEISELQRRLNEVEARNAQLEEELARQRRENEQFRTIDLPRLMDERIEHREREYERRRKHELLCPPCRSILAGS